MSYFSNTPTKPRTKEDSIETLRGIAILLIVVFHCIPEGATTTGSFGYDYLAYSFRLIRVPLFTAISGYIYATHALAPGNTARFVSGKARRLLLPWISVTLLTLLTFVLKRTANGTDHSLPEHFLEAFWLPIGHLWFLPAMMWVFLTVAILEKNRWIAAFPGWLAACAVAWLVAIFFQGIFTPLAFSGYLLIFPFFLFGLGAQRFPEKIFAPGALMLYAVFAIVGLGIHQMIWFGMVSLTSTEYNVLVLVTVYATQGLFFRFRHAITPLAQLGRHSYPIYLFHLIAISIATGMARAAHVENEHALFAMKLAFGLSLSLLAAFFIGRFPLLNLVLLGERDSRRRNNSP
jgi:peptidoglycan/LPS O-acetylase OafA/YrhL